MTRSNLSERTLARTHLALLLFALLLGVAPPVEVPVAIWVLVDTVPVTLRDIFT